MESECSRCHKKYMSSSEDSEFCPNCLNFEFGQAEHIQEVEEEDRQEYEHRGARERQIARARRMKESLSHGETSTYRKMRFIFGILLFILCIFFFILASNESTESPLRYLSSTSLRIISLICCTTSALLVLTSSFQHKFITIPLSLFIAVLGWYLPDIWHSKKDESKPTTESKTEGETRQSSVSFTNDTHFVPFMQGSMLTLEDVKELREQVKSKRGTQSYFVFIDQASPELRMAICHILTRLTGAEKTSSYTRQRGYLFTIENMPGKTQDITNILARFGDICLTDTENRHYELIYIPEKARIVNNYPAEALNSPSHTAFVQANLEEIQSMEPKRVYDAAITLRNANARSYRNDIFDKINQVITEPWQTEPASYAALIEALIVYSPAKNAELIKRCSELFNTNLANNQISSQRIIDYLIDETPDAMVQPVTQLWLNDPEGMRETLFRLGEKAEPSLIEILNTTNDIRQINSILRHLQLNGTPQCSDIVQRFTQHSDGLVRKTAENTLKGIKERAKN